MRYLWKAGLALFGWKTDMEFPYHHIKKYVLLIGPHTSNWDFVLGLAYRNILRMNRTRFLAKKELFKPPFGFIFYWLGGTPVDRKSSHNMVDEVADLFKGHDHFSLCLSPEGTWKKVDRLRTGFYFIAKAANVPIIMVGLDYSRKTVVFSTPLDTTDSQASDMEVVAKFYRTIEGRQPDQGMMHL
jgi:1-acyl-sn-glycerol-3-phosphate acyltransferase